MPKSIETRIEQLEARAPKAVSPESAFDFGVALARVEECQRKLEAEDQLPTVDKIAAKRVRLETLRQSNDVLDALRLRQMEIDILELEGATPEVIEVARTQMIETVRHRAPWPAIPTHEEALAILGKRQMPESRDALPVVSSTAPERGVKADEWNEKVAQGEVEDLRRQEKNYIWTGNADLSAYRGNDQYDGPERSMEPARVF